LEELDEALRYALGADGLFDVGEASEYAQTIVSKCIDEYVRQRNTGEQEDGRLAVIVERMFDKCLHDGEYKQALGIALETHRLDKVKQAISCSGSVSDLLNHCLLLSQTVVQNRAFRQQLLRELVSIYSSEKVPDYAAICQCLLFLDDANSIASLLEQLLRKGSDETLKAFQVAFELSENENQPFLQRVCKALPAGGSSVPDTATQTVNAPQNQQLVERADPDSFAAKLSNLKEILQGEVQTNLFLQFLYSKSKTDIMIIKHVKEKVESKNSVLHITAILAHSLMFRGTTRDKFIRDNLDWLTKASNWAKFAAIASFGVIHLGHHKKGMKLFEPYLPGANARGGPYLEGGALYGLGLIHANRGGDKADYLMDCLRNARDNEIIQHGACLGLGLNAMSTSREDIYEALKDRLNQDNAITGEACGMSMGLVFLGSGHSPAITEMFAYARETPHEKIVRGLGIGMSLIMLAMEEQADGLAEQLLRDQDAILRYSGCFCLASAYVGTANNKAIRRLLHIAVSDVSNDVRRASVIAIGFVLCNQPERLPKVVSLLAESFNADVRYGSALAIGIACCGSGSKAAVSCLKTLLTDRVDFVRQGSMLALAMVLIGFNAKLEPYVEEFKKALTTTIDSKMNDTMTKFGAILASGIIDAGGRNCTLSLLSSNGQKRIASIVGMLVFTQYWYWYPYIHFVSLSFSPIALIALNKNLNMPRGFQVKSHAKPSLFAYPPNVETEKKEQTVQTVKAELSISAKAKARAAKRKKDKEGDDAMEVDEKKDTSELKLESQVSETVPEEKVPEEPEFEILTNPARVTVKQREYLTCSSSQRYVPVTRKLSGIVVLRDTQPNLPEDLIVPDQPKTLGVGEEEEPSPPEPFEFTRD